MADLWTIANRKQHANREQHVEVLRDDSGAWFKRHRANDSWEPLTAPFDVEVFEALRALGMA